MSDIISNVIFRVRDFNNLNWTKIQALCCQTGNLPKFYLICALWTWANNLHNLSTRHDIGNVSTLHCVYTLQHFPVHVQHIWGNSSNDMETNDVQWRELWNPNHQIYVAKSWSMPKFCIACWYSVYKRDQDKFDDPKKIGLTSNNSAWQHPLKLKTLWNHQHRWISWSCQHKEHCRCPF